MSTAAAALSQVTAGSPERSRAAELLTAALERGGDAVDVLEIGEGLGPAAEAAVEGADALWETVGGLLEVVAGLFH